MHVTCTNMPEEKLSSALAKVRSVNLWHAATLLSDVGLLQMQV